VKTDPHSFVGLLGVDQRVLLYTTDNDLDHNQIFNNLEKYSNAVVTLTNAKIYNDPDWCNDILTWRFNNNCPPKHDGLRSSEFVKNTPPSTSQWFPDTWLFSNITEVGDNGNITLD
uniref:Uncharacterized protein LOC108038446 n=1 Tax=Drosophila rhopaloa TaxID=1041015 RepID=A0A6P4DYS5_DRORH